MTATTFREKLNLPAANMSQKSRLAVIGSGPSAIYFLKHFLEQSHELAEKIVSIAIYEKGTYMGMGMPYSPAMVEKSNLANISSEEMPPLLTTLTDWLRGLDDSTLHELNIERRKVNERAIYSRIILGRYLQAQYQAIIEKITTAGVIVREFAECPILDILCEQPDEVTLITGNGLERYDKVLIATGHHWPDRDLPENGYFASPWPIKKILPKEGEYFNCMIGTLGASLSAFDVVGTLATHHGEFIATSSGLAYRNAPGTDNFRIKMHSSHGRLPHLSYSIEKLRRKVYQHVSREKLLDLTDAHGFLRIEVYFDIVCRPALREALVKDGLYETAGLLDNDTFTLKNFVEQMQAEHQYDDAFEGMRIEMVESRDSVLGRNPIHWKEVIDDLIYTLNFHAELMPAEDHIFLVSTVMPFLMNVIAAMPLQAGDQLLALYDAGKLDIISGKTFLQEKQMIDGLTTVTVEQSGGNEDVSYQMFVDCSGQKPVDIEDYPFPSLVHHGVVRRARAKFASDRGLEALSSKHKKRVVVENGVKIFYTGGIDIDGTYRIIGTDGRPNNALFDISFTHTFGVRPYSYGLQSCSDTGAIVVQALKLAFEDSNRQSDLSESEVTTIYEQV